MFLFYRGVLESLVRYWMSAWYGNLSVHLETKLASLVCTAMKGSGVLTDESILMNQRKQPQSRPTEKDKLDNSEDQNRWEPDWDKEQVPAGPASCDDDPQQPASEASKPSMTGH
ncbi:hypothetical protein F2P81_006379 [Scophthalmus maximus]|uniref:Uncharacterized protein n=1 Tax=Scophthalmus maximus TaxID=52904 RepID=A0A6A4TC32_SCOMX|nr:hypothetical protein F2P81_006379 [Scophthalmus maximus]